MAVATQKSVASLMRKTLDRQAAMARVKFTFKKKQVEQILLSYVRDGNSGPYNELLKVLRDCPLNDSNFRILFEDSLSCVVLLGRELKPFIDVVCDIEWASREEDLVEIYSRFVLSLVTAHTYHYPRIMASLIKLFKPDGENWNDCPSPEIISQWSNIHTIIAQIVAVMPLTSDLLMQTVVENFPYYKAGCFPNRAYIHNLIWISKYIPSLTEQIMTAIVSKMVDMDANIVDRDKNKQETIFDMEMDERDEVSETLDYCMLEMLRWLEDERGPVLHTMCSVFERVVLPTHGIRHVQFLVLYTISMSQQCADRVFTNLWIVAGGLHGLGAGAPATRRTAAGHLAGLLARCARVTGARVAHYLRTMADWCHAYLTAQESPATDSSKAHGAFHAVCHAIFYLVAFKNHQLFASKESINFIESLNLPRLVTSPLNPLRSCPPQVTRAFSSVTRAHQVVYCQAIVERNARLSLHGDAHKYDHWFPYDPYTLPVSRKIIWPLCTEYKDTYRDGDEPQHGLTRTLEPEDDDYLMPSPSHTSRRRVASLTHCISPGFKTSESILM